VHHLEDPVAEVDDVPFADLADLRARLLANDPAVNPAGCAVTNSGSCMS
jgi:hypothetical protein